MNRKTFLTVVACISLLVGVLALASPDALLASKGVTSDASVRVWMREVGALLIALGSMTLMVRGHADSRTMRAFLVGNTVLQLLLFPIELLAWNQGVITRAAGVVPNSVLHLVLAAGFAWFAKRCNAAPA